MSKFTRNTTLDKDSSIDPQDTTLDVNKIDKKANIRKK